MTVLAGASYRIAGPLRLGLESVAQDLEEISVAEAEQGCAWSRARAGARARRSVALDWGGARLWAIFELAFHAGSRVDRVRILRMP